MNRFFSPAPFWQTAGLTLIRLTLGVFLIYHAWEIFDADKMKEYQQWDAFKNSSGELMIYAGKAAELVAGILYLFGFLTRFASLLVIGTMGYIAFFLGNGIIWNNDQHPFLFILLALVFFFTGPGNFSLDKMIFKK